MTVKHPLRMALLGAALALSPVAMQSAQAQEKPAAPATRPEGRGEGRQRGNFDPAAMIDRYAASVNELKLTDEQKPKITAAVDKAKKDIGAVTGEGQERFAAMRKVNEELREAVNAVLTDEQKTELRAKTPQRGGPGGGGPGGGTQRIMEQLNLTDDQKTKVAAVMEDQQKKMTALRDGGGDREANREKFTAIRAETQKAIDAILTPEQKEKADKLRAEQPQRGGPGGGQGGQPPRQPL